MLCSVWLSASIQVKICDYLLKLIRSKLFSAILALESFDLEMGFQMFLQVSFLRKTLIAVFILANIWFLFCMHSQMFYEVVPFSEYSVTVVWTALQNLHILHCEWIFKFIDCEKRGLRYDFIYFYLRYIEVLPFKYFYNSIFRYLFFNMLIFYLISSHFSALLLDFRRSESRLGWVFLHWN